MLLTLCISIILPNDLVDFNSFTFFDQSLLNHFFDFLSF